MKQYINILKTLWILSTVSCALVLAVFLIPMIFGLDISIGDSYSVRYGFALQLVCVIVTMFVNKSFKKKLKTASSLQSLTDKLESYKTISTKNLGLCSGLTVLSSFAMILSSNKEFALIPILLLLLIVLKRPFLIKIKMDLSLSEQEMEKFSKIQIVSKSKK